MARTVGQYELIRRLAVGGAAEIYLARKPGLLGFEQHYALKVLLPHRQEDSEHRKMMIDEARLTAQLDHPNIIKVHDLGEEQDVLFMVMEYINGLNLAQIISRLNATQTPMPIEAAVYIAREACGALHYAHTRKSVDGTHLRLVHRDVSPQNVLVGFGGEIKVIDFGVAKATIGGRLETKTGIIKGKLTYMAPEYAVGSQQDHRSDIFAIGLCLYEMLTGQAAYDIEDPRELVEAVKHARIQRPSRIREGVPEELELIVERALEQRPDDRWTTAEELQTALTSFLTRTAGDFRKERLSAWMVSLRDAPLDETQAPPAQPDGSFRTEHGLPGISEADADMNAVVATQALSLDEVGMRPRDTAANRKTDLGMSLRPAPADEAGKQNQEELLGLAGLRDLAEQSSGDDAYDVDDANLATLAMDVERPEDLEATQGQAAVKPVVKPVPTLSAYDDATPDPGVQIQRDFLLGEEIATARTSDLDVGDISPERVVSRRSELPTATDIDVAKIRGDVVQRVPQANRPQILTQSGFQAFAERPRPLDRPTLPHQLLEPMPALDADPLATTGPVALPDGDMPVGAAVGEIVSNDERPRELQQAPVVDENSVAEGLPAVIVEPSPPPPLAPLEKRVPGLTPPEPDPDKPKVPMADSATALINRMTHNYDEYSSTEPGRRTANTVMFAVLGTAILFMLFYLLFFAN